MANPTSNFGWQMPTSTDLVTDLPADFEVFGQAVDTDFVDLLGGANGYILSKASATDLDFAWIPNDQGDITAITVTAPITGGGTSGSVGIAISAASTAASGAVQLSDSTSTTSSVLASTPTATKSAYDLAAAAIPKSTVTTAGDVIYATGSSAVTRLGIGTAGQVLTVAAGVPSWATATATSGPTFSAYGNANQSITATTFTKMAMNTELWDSDNCYNTTNYRFTPNQAGYYQVNVNANVNGTPGRTLAEVYKNGVTNLRVCDSNVASAADGAAGGSMVIDLNGSTDYIEFFLLTVNASTRIAGSAENRFSATWLRSL